MEPRKRLWWTFTITSLALLAFALDRLVVTIALSAMLGLVFAGHGGYASRADFTRGFVPAMWLAAGLAAVGALAAVALPRASGLTDRPARWENKARATPPAGTAGRAADARRGR